MRIVKLIPRNVVAAAAFALAAAVPPAQAQSDADFIAARAAYERGDRVRLDALAPKLQTHLLAPYVEYWQLRSRLDAASADDVRAYLARWPQTPLADRLQLEWLKVLGKRGDWQAFAAEYPPRSREDAEIACYAIQFRRQYEGPAALAAAKPLWFTGQTTPDACDPLFAELIGRGDMTVDDRRLRFRLATETGNVRLAHAIAGDMPASARITDKEFVAVERDPQRALAKGDFRFRESGGRDLALYALERAARKDAGAVRGAWENLRGKLPAAERMYGDARFAFHAARQLHPRAAEWYRDVQSASLSEAERAWRVRAALRAGAWSDVLAAIDAMPALEAQEPAWRYWKARALVATGRGEDADMMYAALAADVGYYGLLASEALGIRVEHASAPLDVDAGALAAFGAREAVKRVVKLTELDMRGEAQREWIYVVRGMSDEALLLAAEYARRQGLYDRAINTADRTAAHHDFALRYLIPYREQFDAAARDQAVDEALLLAIARQESRFAADIASAAGAIGLMQLMPPTARWVAKQLNRDDYRPSRIADVQINTQFGAFYFKYWLERLDGMPALATAAYNAGPGRAQAWRIGTPLEGAVWVETIPFNETRDYVKKVLANTMYYARLLNQSHVSLTQRLGTVPARGEGALAVQAE
jgi:peptidoglycan lytic transglycosylase